jgi:hypothetical protein
MRQCVIETNLAYCEKTIEYSNALTNSFASSVHIIWIRTRWDITSSLVIYRHRVWTRPAETPFYLFSNHRLACNYYYVILYSKVQWTRCCQSRHHHLFTLTFTLVQWNHKVSRWCQLPKRTYSLFQYQIKVCLFTTLLQWRWLPLDQVFHNWHATKNTNTLLQRIKRNLKPFLYLSSICVLPTKVRPLWVSSEVG